MDFESALNDPTASIAFDFEANRSVLLLAFGGLAGRIGLPMFEFNKITSELKDVNKFYLRDKYKLWYHRGLPNVGDNIEGVASFLRHYTTHPSTQRIVVVGNSGGGYAALLFGQLLYADEVHAFVPKTFINPIKRLKYNDIPSGNQIQTWWGLFYYGQRKYFDLKNVFGVSQNTKTNYHIYYPVNNQNDCLHATRLESIARVRLHSYQYGKHNLIKHLKQTGELSQIIERAIRLEDQGR